MNTKPNEELRRKLTKLRIHWYKSVSGVDYELAEESVDDLMQLIQTEIAEAERRAGKAFGGCTKCYGKGYSTSISYNAGGGKKWRKPLINYCTCDRGEQLEQLTEIEVSGEEKK